MKLINKLLWMSLLVLPVACFEPSDDREENPSIGVDEFQIRMGDDDFSDGHSSVPASIVVGDSVVTFSLHGEVYARKDWQNKWDRRTLSFTFPLDTMKMNQFSDLVAWDSLEVYLGSQDSCLVEWKKDYKTDTLDVKFGKLSFTRSKLIGLDGDRNQVFLSGTVDFDYEPKDYFKDDSLPNRGEHPRLNLTSCDGWFDVVVTRGNFSKQ